LAKIWPKSKEFAVTALTQPETAAFASPNSLTTWSLQDAKNNLSKLVKAAALEPQFVTVHGKPAGVVVSYAQFQSLLPAKQAAPSKTGADLIAAIQANNPGIDMTDEELDAVFRNPEPPSLPKVSLDDWER
jgi:prevent-host-death family protein